MIDRDVEGLTGETEVSTRGGIREAVWVPRGRQTRGPEALSRTRPICSHASRGRRAGYSGTAWHGVNKPAAIYVARRG